MLKLRYSSASPYVRKVLVLAHEAGLIDRIEIAPADVWASDSDIFQDNPLGKVPALVTPDGTFIGSTLCCEYLDTLHDGRRLIPIVPVERWPVFRLHALADGIMDAAVAHVIEQHRRPAAFVYEPYLERQIGKIQRALDALETEAASLGERIDLATIAMSCALGYLDFRLPKIEWRKSRPRLAQWEAVFAKRSSMAATTPYL